VQKESSFQSEYAVHSVRAQSDGRRISADIGLKDQGDRSFPFFDPHDSIFAFSLQNASSRIVDNTVFAHILRNRKYQNRGAAE